MQNIKERNNRQVATWLLIGVAIIIVQVIIGGITRLTESGLSITEWKPITGALPPLNHEDWLAEFEKYKNTDQFKYLHQNFSLSDFKQIFFWEWSHRVWARLLGVVFLVGFIYFLLKRKFSKRMVVPMIILFLLGALQGLIGWLMVKSGLVPEKFFVGHIELATHFIAALILLCYTLWFSLSLMPSMQTNLPARSRSMLLIFSMILFIQLVYGGFMAGLKAAKSAPTWPDINGQILPTSVLENSSFAFRIANDPLYIQFIHRGIGYMLFITGIAMFFNTRNILNNRFRFFRKSMIVLLCTQVLLGITSLITATSNSFIIYATLHQFVAILIVMNTTILFYLSSQRNDNMLAG